MTVERQVSHDSSVRGQDKWFSVIWAASGSIQKLNSADAVIFPLPGFANKEKCVKSAEICY